MAIAKCPKCDKNITEIIVSPVNAKNGNKILHSAVYTCPHCHVILSAGPDPYSLVDEIVNRIHRPNGS
jgi:uncharacterized protein with PIN domain